MKIHTRLEKPAAALAALCAGTALAYDQPTVNLGFTSFLDGGPPAGPGLYAVPYFNYYHATQFRGTPFSEGDLTVYAGIVQLVYQTDLKLPLGAQPGLNVMLPFVEFDLNNAGPLLASGGGMGDTVIGPFLQWNPVMGKNGPVFMHRVEFQCITPTGKYDPTCNLNPGANFFSFDPYWAGTLFITPKWTFSTRVHYLWNDVNNQPVQNAAPPALQTQAGQAFHLNFAMDYQVCKSVRAGVNGYYLTQASDSLTDGKHLSDRGEEVLGIGPGLLYSLNKDTHVFFNSYIETAAQNRPEGFRLNLRLVRHF